jgi:hypothetical protein
VFKKRSKAAEDTGIDAGGSPISRRRLFGTGAAMGVGMAAGGSLLRAKQASAADGNPVILGGTNTQTYTTVIENLQGDGNGVLSVVANGASQNAIGASMNGPGAAIQGYNTAGGSAFTGTSVSGEGLYAQSGQMDGTNPGNTRSGVHGVTNSPTDSGVWGEAIGGGAGVTGSTSGTNGGVQGLNLGGGPGLYGTSASGEGLYGQSGTVASAFAGTSLTGVHGVTNSDRDSAVWGEAVGGGAGVTGSTSGSNGGVQGVNAGAGPGVLAQNTGAGPALSVVGPAAFNRSGVLAIAANKSSVTLSGISLGAASLVLATIQGAVAGIYVEGVTVVTGSSGSFTVHLNKATTKALNVGWFVVN